MRWSDAREKQTSLAYPRRLGLRMRSAGPDSNGLGGAEVGIAVRRPCRCMMSGYLDIQ